MSIAVHQYAFEDNGIESFSLSSVKNIESPLITSYVSWDEFHLVIVSSAKNDLLIQVEEGLIGRELASVLQFFAHKGSSISKERVTLHLKTDVAVNVYSSGNRSATFKRFTDSNWIPFLVNLAKTCSITPFLAQKRVYSDFFVCPRVFSLPFCALAVYHFTVRYLIVKSNAEQSANLDPWNLTIRSFRILCRFRSILDQTNQYKSKIQHYFISYQDRTEGW